MRKLRVFVSYSRHDTETERISAFVDWLSELSNRSIEFVLDTTLRGGDDIRQFEKTIAMFSYVLVIGTPQYKYKSTLLTGGVSREYAIISSLYENNKITLFLAQMTDSFDDCFPERISSPLARSFSNLKHDPKTGSISSRYRTMHQSNANDLVTDILTKHQDNRPPRKNIDEIKTDLFFETKHESMGEMLSDEILKKLFVVTSCYDAANNRKTYLFIGRKGSGKSFLTDYFTRYPIEKNTIPVNIHFSNFSLLNIFQMRTTSSIDRDIDHVLPLKDIFESAWCLFIVANSILNLYLYIRDTSNTAAPPFHKIAGLAEFAEKCRCIADSAPGVPASIDTQRLIDWCTEIVFQNISEQFQSLDGEYPAAVAMIPSFVAPARIIKSILGEKVVQAFINAASQFGPTFLVTVDGFDTKFDKFRRHTGNLVFSEQEKRRRVHFEIDWLSGLIEASQRLLSWAFLRSLGFPPTLRFRFLITLPRDRFLETLRADRDAVRLRNKYIEIRWNAHELMDLARQRLEIFYEKSCHQATPDAKLNESLAFIGQFPTTLRFPFNDQNIEIDLFSYFLRHTFWRPRDILYHIAQLIVLSEKAKRTGRPISVDQIREITRISARDIVEHEFIGEFSTVFERIEACLKRFQRKSMLLSYSNLYETVREIDRSDFRLGSGDYLDSPEERIDFLFEIGFLGINLDESTRARIGERRREIFSFSAPDHIYKDLDNENKSHSSWMIHPIFAEYLQLETNRMPFLLHYKSDDFLTY